MEICKRDSILFWFLSYTIWIKGLHKLWSYIISQLLSTRRVKSSWKTVVMLWAVAYAQSLPTGQHMGTCWHSAVSRLLQEDASILSSLSLQHQDLQKPTKNLQSAWDHLAYKLSYCFVLKISCFSFLWGFSEIYRMPIL